MSIRRAFLFLVLTGVFASPAVAAAPNAGVFSRGATDVWGKVAGNPAAVTFTSPDRTSTIVIGGRDDDPLPFHVRGRLGRLDFGTADVVDAELVWAPDSSAAFFTGSDGGAVGTYGLHVIHVHEGQLVETNLSPMIIKRFGQPVRCYTPEPPNVGGIAWLGKDRLLVAAEIPPHTNCDAMGTFKAYEVDLATMTIVRAYNQYEAKHRFRAKLGAELRNADDSCARRPRACEIPGLHGRKP